jgi:pimeloyl-ACP methyl ester carboxylesterase
MNPNGSSVTVDTPALSVCCELSGPPDGYPCVLLHGWPDDVRTWDQVLAPLQAANLRIIAPYLRGVGQTRFRDPAAMRNGQLAALGKDVLELAEALGLERFAVVGHDWGARAAYIASCLAGPARISHCAALSVGWGTNDPRQSLSLRQVQNYWYHWYMALERGSDLVRDDRRNFTRHIWSIWNPGWRISDAEFERTAASFDNPDWADVVLHSYRVRWGLAPTDPALEEIEMRLTRHPQIGVPTLVLHGGADPCNDPSTSEGKEHFFTGPYQRIVLPDVGHFPQRQDAEAVAGRLVRFLTS